MATLNARFSAEMVKEATRPVAVLHQTIRATQGRSSQPRDIQLQALWALFWNDHHALARFISSGIAVLVLGRVASFFPHAVCVTDGVDNTAADCSGLSRDGRVMMAACL